MGTNTCNAVLHGTDGSKKDLVLDLPIDLQAVREKHLGGAPYPELIRLRAGEHAGSVLIIDGNGLARGLPLNPFATLAYKATCRPEYQAQAIVVGPAVLVDANALEYEAPEDTNVCL